MLLVRHGWAVAASSRLGLGACEGERALSVLSKYQWCFNNLCYKSYRKMHFSRDWLNKSGERKKRKITGPVWRPTSNQLSSAFCSMESYHENTVETECVAASTSDGQYFAQTVEAVSNFTGAEDQLPSTLDCCKQDEVSEERSVMSVSTDTCLCESESVETFYENELNKERSGDFSCATDALLASNYDRHSLCVEVGSLARFIKGKWGLTQRRIEEEFGVKIKFPTSKKESSIAVVEGVSADSVTGASEKIMSLLEEVTKSKTLDFSHFVSLPLGVHGELVEKVTEFQNTILGNAGFVGARTTDSNTDEDCNDNDNILPKGADVIVKLDDQKKQHTRVEFGGGSTKSNKSLADLGIDKSIFLKPKQLHLTVLMLRLHNKDRIALANEILQTISSKVMDALDHRPVSIRLRGLACMRGSPAKAYVLYAPVEETDGEDRLRRACQVIIKAYLEAGLVLKEDAGQALKLHATLMNTRQRKRSGKDKKRPSPPFDARDIIKKYGSMEWGEYPLQEVHLSQRFLYDDNGYYHCCSLIPLPRIS